MIVLSTEIQESLARTNTHELTQARLIRLAAAQEAKLEALQAKLDHRQEEFDRVRQERDAERRKRQDLELRLSDAEHHRDSLAGMLERRRLERADGTDAPIFSHGMDNR